METGCVLLFVLLSGRSIQGDVHVIPQDSNGLDVLSMHQSEEELQVNARCTFCKFFVQQLDGYLKDSSLILKLNDTLMPECMKFLKIKYLCSKMVEFLDTELENLINTELSPEHACEASGFCPKDNPLWNRVANFRSKGPDGPILCDLCKLAAGEVDTLLDYLMETVKQELEKFCHRLTPPADEKCLDGVDNLVNTAENLIKDGPLGVQTVCTKDLHIC